MSVLLGARTHLRQASPSIYSLPAPPRPCSHVGGVVASDRLCACSITHHRHSVQDPQTSSTRNSGYNVRKSALQRKLYVDEVHRTDELHLTAAHLQRHLMSLCFRTCLCLGSDFCPWFCPCRVCPAATFENKTPTPASHRCIDIRGLHRVLSWRSCNAIRNGGTTTRRHSRTPIRSLQSAPL